MRAIGGIAALFWLAGAGLAQQTWEAGLVVGGGFYLDRTFSNALGKAKAGFGEGVAFGGFLAQNLYRHVSGEIRYAYQRGDLRVSSGGRSASFRGDSHAFYYDFLIHRAPADASRQLFFVGGAGFKRYRGTGAETVTQPLSEFALLTQTSEWKPLISAGAGVKFKLSRRAWLRLEVRDNLTPFPQKVVTPATGTTVHGWLHDIVPAIGLSVEL